MNLPSNTNSVANKQPASGQGLQALRFGEGTLDSDQQYSRVNPRTLILVRWIAIAGQLVAVLFVHFQLRYELPLVALMGMIGLSALLNLGLTFYRRSGQWLSQAQTGQLLLFDVLQLAVLLYLTGGLANPFSVLMVAPVTIAASLLSRQCVIGLTVATLLLISVLAVFHYPVSLDLFLQLSPLHLLGVWVALCVATVFMAVYAYIITRDVARLNDAVEATQQALQTEQRMSALGALAAAAAHELGSPLSTITLVAKEMANDLEADSPLAEDVELLQSQAERCRKILAELSQQPDKIRGEAPYNILPLSLLVEQVADPHQIEGVDLQIMTDPRDSHSREPRVLRTPELVHGLGNVVQNAIQFAEDKVTVTVYWDADHIRLTIHDNGPGIPPALLSRLGEPYVSGRADKSHGMGLGIFIARTLLERCHARLNFANHPMGGAMAIVDWSRSEVEVPITAESAS